jgi:hypothetical protein
MKKPLFEKEPEKASFSLEIEKDLLDKIRATAKRQNITIRQIVEYSLSNFLEQVEKEINHVKRSEK